METKYWTVDTVVEALGMRTYKRLKSTYDPKVKARRTKLFREVQPCVGCGRSSICIPKNQRAHIDPVAEGFPTEHGNVLFLCRKFGQDASDCCHWLFDHGYASANEVRISHAAPIGMPFELGRQLRTRYKAFGPQSREAGEYAKHEQDLTEACEHQNPDPESRTIERAEIARRRPTADSLVRALSILDEVRPEEIGNRYTKARYFYERAYINLLQGQLEEARRELDGSLHLLDDYRTSPASAWRWAAHRATIAQIDVLRAPTSGIDRCNSLSDSARAIVEILEVVLDAERRLAIIDPWTIVAHGRRDRTFVGRWVQNMLHDRCRINVLQGEAEEARRSLNQALDRWKDCHLANGWETAFRPLLVALHGHVRLLCASNDDDIRAALGLLIRALVMFRGRQQQPEGAADILRGIGKCLKALNDCAASNCYAVGEEYRDAGSWGFWVG